MTMTMPLPPPHVTNPYAPPRSNVTDLEPEPLEPADRGTRLGASLLDGLISGLPAVALIWGVLAWLGYSLLRPSAGALSERWALFIGMLIAAGVNLAINGYLLATFGQSVGKRLCHIRIVRQDGSAPTLWDSFVKRHFAFLLLGQVPVVGNLIALVDVLFIFRENRLCLHDHLAGTRVVKVPRCAPAPVQEALPPPAEVPVSVASLELCPYCAEAVSEFTNACRGCGRNPFKVDGATAHRSLTVDELLRKAARLYDHGLQVEALAVHVCATRYHPHQRSAWLALRDAPNAEAAMKTEAQEQFRRIEQLFHS